MSKYELLCEFLSELEGLNHDELYELSIGINNLQSCIVHDNSVSKALDSFLRTCNNMVLELDKVSTTIH